jgi:type VI secretion system protein ImpC
MQAIEAAWRALFMMVRGLNTDSDLHLYVMDITLPELVSEMGAVEKELRRKGPWALVAGNYTFAQTELDAQVLQRLAGLAAALGAPFLAEAQLPNKEAEQAWADLRNSPGACWIGLALPRFLLRLPYGKDTDSLESFPFEEMPRSEHAAYLWGNPAFFCAYLLGKSFLEQGWEMSRLERRIDGLPMHVYRENGEPVAKPCAEALMTEKDALSLLEAGFMPLASLKHEPAAMIVRFQSIAQPLAPLAGLH